MQGYSYYDIVIVLCDMFMISWDIIMAPRICMSIILNLKIVFDYQCHPGLLQGPMILMFERVANGSFTSIWIFVGGVSYDFYISKIRINKWFRFHFFGAWCNYVLLWCHIVDRCCKMQNKDTTWNVTSNNTTSVATHSNNH